MYCKKCGQEIDPNVGYCKDCEQNDMFFSSKNVNNGQPYQSPNYGAPQMPDPSQTPTAKPEQPGDWKFGFGKALAATILGAISYFIMAIALGVPMGIIEELELAAESGMAVSDLSAIAGLGAVVTLVFFVLALALAIPALILGIQSIRCFVRRKKEGYVKPIATLILGIVGTATAAFAFLFGALTLLLLSLLALYI